MRILYMDIRRLLPFCVVLLMALLAGCTTEAERLRMCRALDSINALNRSSQPFTVQDVEPLVAYFDRHGTSDNRVLAHYLLGRAHHEHGEAPAALQCYHDALDCVDTTRCDFALLSRVYGQMAEIFYYQGLYRDMLIYNHLAEQFAWKDADTTAALINREKNYIAFSKLGIKDSAIIICEDVAQLYLQYGSLKDAAISLGAAIRPLIDIGDYGKAKSYMDLYEAKSERFDTMGNIEHGREIYYKAKGLYYLNTGKLDSAEYFFRKELQNGSDFNNLHAAAKGLAELYQILKRPDSVAKYFAYAYAMNDSLYAQTTAKDIERIHSAYNYSRHQEEAYRESVKSERANRFLLISCIILLTIFLIATWLSIALKKMTKAFERMSDELEQLKTERTELLQNKSDNLMELEEKEQRIKQLKKKMGRYGKLIYFSPNKANTAMEKSSRYKEIKEKGLKGEKFSADDWTTVQCLVNEYLPGFYDFINLRLKAESKEYKVCELLRLSFEVKEIANAFGVTPPYISKISSKIYQEVFKKQGSSKDLAKEILKLA